MGTTAMKCDSLTTMAVSNPRPDDLPLDQFLLFLAWSTPVTLYLMPTPQLYSIWLTQTTETDPFSFTILTYHTLSSF
jgi:hypothetical protein